MEEIVARRRAVRRLRIAQTAYRELSTVGFDVMVAIVRAAGGDPSDVDGMADSVTAKLRRQDELADFLLQIKEQSERAAQALARWAPIMLQDDELAADLALFAEMRDDLLVVPRIVFSQAPDWEVEAGHAFSHFVSTFALFNAQRAVMLGEIDPADLDEEVEVPPPTGSPAAEGER